MTLSDAPRPPPDRAPPPGRTQFTFDDLLKMREAGVFVEGQHVELVDGAFVTMPGEGTFHLFAVRVLGEWLADTLRSDAALHAKAAVYHHGTLLFDRHNRREPDLMVADRVGPAQLLAPSSVRLVVECAATSALTDLNSKRLEYAAAGIAEYWVWETGPQRLSVFRRPQDGDYAFRDTLIAGQTIAPLFAPGAAFEVDTLTSA